MSQRGKIGRLVAHGEGEGMFAFDPNVPKVDIEGEDSVIFAGLLEIVACCEMCTNDGTKVCARCSVARYCSRTCQRTHWSQTHREACQCSTGVAATTG